MTLRLTRRKRSRYSIALAGGVFAATPNIGFRGSCGGAQDWRIGWRVASAPGGGAALEVSLDATRREPASDDAPEQEVLLRAAIRW